MLSNPGGDSIVTPWEKILKYNPEVMVIAPCGFETKRTKDEMRMLTEKPGWMNIKAVHSQQVYLADYDLFTQPSASTLTDGIELLAGIIHPDLFAIPPKLTSKYSPFPKTRSHVRP
jgi:iron complex transport system substrate-binding protein